MSLIGIIFVQGYWISESVKNEKEQFSLNVKRALGKVVAEIENREIEDLFHPYKKLSDSIGLSLIHI